MWLFLTQYVKNNFFFFFYFFDFLGRKWDFLGLMEHFINIFVTKWIKKKIWLFRVEVTNQHNPQHSTTLQHSTGEWPPAPLGTSRLSAPQVNDPRHHTAPHGTRNMVWYWSFCSTRHLLHKWSRCRFHDSTSSFKHFSYYLYLTQFLTDFSQILDSKSYDQA